MLRGIHLQPWRTKGRHLWESAAYRLSPPKWDEVVGEQLTFGVREGAFYLDMVSSSQNYLEFGSGSSTMVVAGIGKPLATVESNSEFLAFIEDRCRHMAVSSPAGRMNFVLGDIGETGPWGRPIFPSYKRPRRWRNYPLAPWNKLGATYRADLVLVDGRFRVACALALVLQQRDADWNLLVDDFSDRPEYSPIKEFAQLRGLNGRMAHFQPKHNVDLGEAARAFEYFVSDWR